MSATEPVGTVAEEAVKLVGAFGDWLAEHRGDTAAAGANGEAHTEPCTSCPLCVVRAALTKPEVRHHLAAAAESFLAAVAAVVDRPGGADRT